jgi:WD40 repeat protein
MTRRSGCGISPAGSRSGRPWVAAATTVAFSPDGRTLASTGRDHAVRLWDVKTQERVGSPFTNHRGALVALAFLPGGDRFASAGLDGVRIARTTSPLVRTLPKTGTSLLNVEYSADGKRLAWGGGGTLYVRDVTSRGQRRLYGPGPIHAVEYNADGARVRWHGNVGKVEADTVGGLREMRVLTPTGNVNNLSFSGDGRFLAWAAEADHTVRILDLFTGRERVIVEQAKYVDTPKSIALSRDGRTVAYNLSEKVSDVPLIVRGRVRIWDLVHNRPVRAQPPSHREEDHGIAISPDGRTLAYGGDDKIVRLWDIPHGRLIVGLSGHKDTILGMAFRPDGRVLASAGRDSAVFMWDVKRREQLGLPLLSNATLYGVSFGPDGTVAAGTGDGTVDLWDSTTHRVVNSLSLGLNVIFDVAFRPGGRELALGAADGTVRVWNLGQRLDYAIKQLCGYIDRKHAEKTWNLVEPSIDFEKPC